MRLLPENADTVLITGAIQIKLCANGRGDGCDTRGGCRFQSKHRWIKTPIFKKNRVMFLLSRILGAKIISLFR